MSSNDREISPPASEEEDRDALGRLFSRRELLRKGGEAALGSALLASGAGSFLTGAASAASAPRRGGHLVEGYMTDIRTMNPWNVNTSADGIINGMLFAGLIGLSANGTPVPALAAEVPRPSKEDVIVVKLRPGLKWSDGAPLTADDVVFTYSLLIDPAFQSFQYQGRSTVTSSLVSVHKKDALTAILQLKGPNAAFIDNYCYQGILPQHVLGSVSASDLNTSSFFSGPSAASGPFQFVSWQRAQQVTLKRNPHYWAPTLLDGYVFRALSDAIAVGTALQTGEVDVGVIDISQVSQLQHASKINLVPFSSGQVWEVWYQQRPSHAAYQIFGDHAVRQALRQAVDIRGLIHTVFNDQGTFANSPFSPITWAYDAKAGANFKYNDPVGAGKLLDAAGWRKGSDGIRAKNGVRLSFELLAANVNTLYTGTAQVLQQEWSKLGAEVTLTTVALSEIVNRAIITHNFDAVLVPPLSTGDPDNFTVWWASANGVGPGVNISGYGSPGVDRAIKSARQLYAPKRRKIIYDDIQEALVAALPAAWLVYGRASGGINKRVQGFHWNAVASTGQRPWMNEVWVSSGR